MITGSALPRLLNCPSSAVLEKAGTESPWAELGNIEHDELAEQVLAGTLPPELAKYVPPNPRAEIKLSYDVATQAARFLGAAADRNYGTPGPFEIFLSSDFLGIDELDRVVVGDWKTGYGEVEAAATNGQLWGGALAACRALGKDSAVIRIIYTKQGPRCDEHEIDALDLAAFSVRLGRLHTEVAERRARKARGELLDTREGSWCKYCESKHVCPSKNALLLQVAEKGLSVIGETELTKARAAAAYAQLVNIEQLVRDARKRLERYVDEQGPIDLGDGKMYGRYIRPGNERLDGAAAIEAIRAIIGGEDAAKFEKVAIEYSTSKAAIMRAAKQIAPPRGATKLSNAVINQIRGIGGASHYDETFPYGEYLRGEAEAAPPAEFPIAEINRMLAKVG